MVSVSSEQPSYLVSATSLIKALKSARDPPQPDWPSKIDIASHAWQRRGSIGHGLGGRIGDVIREWLLESWVRTKGAKGTKNELLNAAYHDLLRSIIIEHSSSSAIGISTTQSHQFLTAFLLALRLSPELMTEKLLVASSRLFYVLFGYKTSLPTSKQGGSSINGVLVKAENWLETLGGLIALCSHIVDVNQAEDATSHKGKAAALPSDLERSQGLFDLAQLIVVETNASLAISQTRRKITLNIIKPLVPAYLKVISALSLVKEPLETLIGPLFWPLAVLQPQTQSSQASSSESAGDPAETVIRELVFPANGQQTSSTQATLSTLSFIPALSKEYVGALQANRYAIFPPPSASANARSKSGTNIPPDVYVGDKVRESVRGYMRIVLQCVAQVEQSSSASAESGKGSSSRNASPASSDAVRLEVWRTRNALWHVVKQWGGYFEGDAEWRQLVTETVTVSANWLAATGLQLLFGSTSTRDASKSSKRRATGIEIGNGAEKEIYASLEQLFSTLLELDYGACKVDTEEEGMIVLAASLLNDIAHTNIPIQAVLRYHTLTQSIPEFAVLLTSVVRYCFSSTAASTMTQRDIYNRLASGPLVSPDFRASFEKALNGTFVGGISEERGWGNVVTQLGSALRESMVQMRAAGETDLHAAQSEGSSKRRRKNDGTVATVSSTTAPLPAGAGTFAILSRVLAIVLDTAYGKGQGYEKHGRAEDVLRIVDLVANTWQEQVNSAGNEEVASGILRLRKAEELLRREVPVGQPVIVQGQGEASFEQGNLHLQTWAVVGKAEAQTLSAFITSLAAQQPTPAWSGRVVDLTNDTSVAALWHVVAQRGLTVTEENATDEELDSFTLSLLNNIPVSMSGNIDVPETDGLSLTRAIERVLSSAEFWELARIRSAILKGIQKAIDAAASPIILSIYALLLQAPSDFLTKTVRNAAVKRAFAIDAAGMDPSSANPLKASERELIRRFMVKIVKDTDTTGPLAEGDVLMRFIDQNASAADGVEQATRELISIAIDALLKDSLTAKSTQALKLLITTAQQKLAQHVLYTDQKGLFHAIHQLFQSAVDQSDSLSSDIAAQLTPLSQSILDNFILQLRPEDQTLFTSKLEDTLERVGILFAVTRYRRRLSLNDNHRHLANQLCIGALKPWNHPESKSSGNLRKEQAACILLKWVVVQSDPSTDINDMKVFFASWSAFAALLGGSQLLESSLRDVFGSATGEVLEALLALLASVLEHEVEDDKGILLPALRALAVVTALSIPHTGRIYRSTLARILSGLKRLLQRSQNDQVQLECLRLVEVISSEKPVILVHQDVSDMLAICYTALLPASPKGPVSRQADRERDINTAHPHLNALLSTVSTLVRHRRDLVINVLPQLMKLFARIFELFGVPRNRGAVGGSQARVKRLVKREWPIWLAGRGEGGGLGEEDARAFARALVTLTSRTIIRTTTSSNNAGAGTMIGQLSKHAPVLLIAYVRAVAHPLSTIPASSRHELVPGIGAMCEAVVAGGKAMLGGAGSASGSGGASENRTAESIGEAFGLGQGLGGEGELIVWGEMWRAWRRSRYVGQG